ncbi:MAG: PglZ domain-containing protein [Candidatus Heimdallarchaeota archaeon]|nr:PglZ domain-containing protein [Candidatus Heimdallarchaeota archaeon]
MHENSFPLKSINNRDDLFYPDLELNISKVLPTALSVLGKNFPKTRLLNKYLNSKKGWDSIQKSEISNVVFIVLDALGFEHFMRYSKILKLKFKTNGIALCSVFPTITSTCMTTINLGQMPVNHGIVGQKIRFNEIDNIVDTLTMRTKQMNQGDIHSFGINVQRWLWSDFISLDHDKFEDLQLIEKDIANKGLSHLTRENQNAIGYYSHIDCFAAAKRILEHPREKKLFLNIYISSIDSISHRYTTESQELEDEIENIERLLFKMFERIDPKIATKTAVFITADHGQENLTEEQKIIITEKDEDYLSTILTTRGRSGRVIHLFVKDGKKKEVVSWFKDKIGKKGIIITSEEYPKFFGKGANNEKVIQRIGEVQIILGKNASIFFGHSGDYDQEYNLALNATHGSLSRNELVVPLLFGTIEDLLK